VLCTPFWRSKESFGRRMPLRKVMRNTGWMLFDKIFRQGTVFCLNIWITRYLGPEKFGLLSYATAFVSLFMAVANLGLFGIVTRDLVKYPESRNEIIGTALLLKIVGGLTAVVLAVTTIHFLRPEDTFSLYLVVIVSSGMIFQAFEVFDFWFLSQLQSKNSFWANFPGFLLIILVKIMLVVTGAPLSAFAWATFFEIVLAAMGFLFMYHRTTGELLKLQFSLAWTKRPLKDSFPLIFAGLMMMIYTRIDQVMLGQMTGDGVVGVYSAAAKIAEFWYVLPTMLLQSLYPGIIAAKNINSSTYANYLQRLFDSMAVASWLFALPLCLFAGSVITLLYGKAYVGAATVLSVYVMSGIFVMVGHVREYWVTVENCTRFSLYSTSLGALVNIILNLILIPRYGAVGAAYATLFALVAGSYLMNLFSSQTRHIFRMQTSAIMLFPAILRLSKHGVLKKMI
jgi:polysaccharide transporter, PST family